MKSMPCIFIAAIGALIIIGCKSSETTGDNNNFRDIARDQFYQEYAEKNLPAPPEGKEWKVDEQTTDEFEGEQLNTDKWWNPLQGWRGRAPGRFIKKNVSVNDGTLQITNTWLDEKIEAGGKTYTIGNGAVGSKYPIIYPVYTEARLRASNMPLSTTFWLMGETTKALEDNIRYTTELDIIETVAGPYSWDDPIEAFNTSLHSNTHFRTRKPGKSEIFYSRGAGEHKPLGYKTHEEFHTYGLYWVDATHAKFYVDGELYYNISFDDSQKENPFDIPMHLRMVTETYNWLNPPTKEMLEDDSRNKTSRYEWVRTFKLVDK